MKQPHRTRTKVILPPKAEFTEHYSKHYQLGEEEPIEVHACELPELETDDTLSREDFDAGLCRLNENRSPGHAKCSAEYLKRSGSLLANWLFVLLTRVWKFVTDLPPIDRNGALVPVPKKTSSTSVDAA